MTNSQGICRIIWQYTVQHSPKILFYPWLVTINLQTLGVAGETVFQVKTDMDGQTISNHRFRPWLFQSLCETVSVFSGECRYCREKLSVDNLRLASCPWGPVTANGVDLLTKYMLCQISGF